MMANRSSRGSEQPEIGSALRARGIDREPIRGLHQGQRSCVPHRQAGDMTAPDHLALPSKSSCPAGAVQT